MEHDLFIVDLFEDVADVVMHYSHFIKPFICSSREEFVDIITVYGTWIKTIETFVEGEFLYSGSSGIVGKFSEREPCLLVVLPIVLRESYVLVYKLVVMGLIGVEYIRVGRTSVNAYSIRIKL